MRPFLIAVTLVGVLLALPSGAAAAMLTTSNGGPTYTADAGEANDLIVSLVGSELQFEERGRAGGQPITIKTTPGSGCNVSPPSGGRTTATCPTTGTGLDVVLGDLDDVLQVSVNRRSNLGGGPGADRLSGGDGRDGINGDDGDDVLDGGAGSDRLNGGTGADTLNGGPDTDTADYFFRKAPLVITLDGTPGDGEAGERDNVGTDVEDVRAGLGDDYVLGNEANNNLYGDAGADTIRGLGGDDRVTGAGGADVLDGGPGVDTLSGGDDPDSLEGGPDRDQLSGGGGQDWLRGGSGADTMDGGTEEDRLHALDRETDQVNCGAGEDATLADAADNRNECEQFDSAPAATTTRTARLRRGSVRLKVSCSRAAAEVCAGSIYLKAGRILMAKRAFSVKPGITSTLRVVFSRRGRSLLLTRRRITASARFNHTDPLAGATIQTLRLKA